MTNQGELYEGDPTIRLGEDGNWYHYPHKFLPKLIFLIGSLVVLSLGFVTIWPPLSRLVMGERNTARLVEITRTDPGKDPEIIRYRKSIPEGSIDTTFSYTIEIRQKDGEKHLAQLAIGSRRNAFNNINDSFEVISFPNEPQVFQLFEHRTWAFGTAFLVIGSILTACAIPTLLAVGKPILIDSEAPRSDENPDK